MGILDFSAAKLADEASGEAMEWTAALADALAGADWGHADTAIKEVVAALARRRAAQVGISPSR